MNRFKFFREGIRNIKTVGTVTRSSRFLCEKIIQHSDISRAKYIVELGAGDGVLTKRILDKMPSDCKLIAFEINDKFIELLNQIDDERLIVAGDTAENLPQYMKRHEIEQIDIIYSAIPFSVIPDKTAREIVNISKSCMKNSGEYLQIHYSLIEKKMYSDIFGNVKVYFQPFNFPPAFILKSIKD